MTKLLLHIEASPRKNRSSSSEIGHAFIEGYLDHHPTHRVKTINVWHYDLPEMTGELLKSVYSSIFDLELNHKEKDEWRIIKKIAEEFKEADKYLITTPMWNFSIPYRLKHYLDVLVQPGLTYQLSKQGGFQGLVTGKPIAVVSARGGEYVRQAQKLDMQLPYLDQILRFIGFEKIEHILIQPTLDSSLFATKEAVHKAHEEALRQVELLAVDF